MTILYRSPNILIDRHEWHVTVEQHRKRAPTVHYRFRPVTTRSVRWEPICKWPSHMRLPKDMRLFFEPYNKSIAVAKGEKQHARQARHVAMMGVAAYMPRRPNIRPTSIYWLIDTRNGVPFYCGKTVLPLHQRLAQHKYEAAHGNRRVHVKFRECGDNIRIHQAELVPVGGDWAAREKRWIFLLREMYPESCNTADGGAGAPGWVPSAETRAKLSAWQIGRRLSPEHRAKISKFLTGKKRSRESVEKGRAKMIGRKLTPDQCAAISARSKARFDGPQGDSLRLAIGLRRKGVVASAETRAKQSAAHTGRKLTPEQRAAISARNKGRKMSAEAIEKSAAARTGAKRTPEQRARMSAAHKGRKATQAQRDAISAGLFAAWRRRKSEGQVV